MYLLKLPLGAQNSMSSKQTIRTSTRILNYTINAGSANFFEVQQPAEKVTPLLGAPFPVGLMINYKILT